jgi:hypothetical protein
MAHTGRLLPLLSNRYEQAADELLQKISGDTGDRLMLKMRLASVIDINTLDAQIPGGRWFALSAELDYAVFDGETGLPKFAVELDGRQHWTDVEQRRKDAAKDRLCEHAGLPQLRVTSDFVHTTGRWPLLSYTVNAFYLSEAFFEAQENRSAPQDEPFYVGNILTSLRGVNGGFLPGTFDALAIRDLWSLYRDGLIPRPIPNTFRVRPDEGRGVRAIAYLPVAKDRYLISESRVRDFPFQGIGPYDLAEEICVVDIANAAADWLAGKPVARNSATMHEEAAEIQRLIDDGQIASACAGTGNIKGSKEFSIRLTHRGR